MRKKLKIPIFMSIGLATVFGSTTAVISCGEIDKTKISADEINDKLKALNVTFAGPDGHGMLVGKPDWNVGNTILVFGVSDNATPPESYFDVPPFELKNTSTLYLSAIVFDENSEIVGTIIPKVIPVTGLPSPIITPNAANDALNLITSLTFTGVAGSNSTFNDPTYSISNTSLIYATSTTDSQPAIGNFSTTKPTGFSNGDYIWISAKAISGYIFSSDPVVKKYTVSGVNVSPAFIQAKVDAVTSEMAGWTFAIRQAFDVTDATNKLGPAIMALNAIKINAIKIDSSDSIWFTFTGQLYATSRPFPITVTLHFSGHGVTVSQAFNCQLKNPPV